MSKRPLSLVVAAVILAVEGLVAFVLGCVVGVLTVTSRPSDLVTSIVVAAFGLLVGAGLIWVGWGLFTAQRWGRSPAVLTQIIAVPVAITLIESGQPAMGVPLIVAAAVAAVGLLAPPTTRALYGDDPRPGD
ncbi:hypothetical protein [Spongiactinospora sp. TRM90649]|uniref:hypothetical protein n=1 Tax=Spongiactinospora sp. TRM90649 TaxID=3031114 RepID=UPI0023F7AC1F|nr:hypothetical protein [Spongiactinospora sp. TRM90649]MDF5756489.1 hypothetical protein [Spongiactinospora sp. TRM90649]